MYWSNVMEFNMNIDIRKSDLTKKFQKNVK